MNLIIFSVILYFFESVLVFLNFFFIQRVSTQ